MPELVDARVELEPPRVGGRAADPLVEDGVALPLLALLVEHDPVEVRADVVQRAWKSQTAHWGRSRQREKCRIIDARSSASLQAVFAPVSAVETTSLPPVVSSRTPRLGVRRDRRERPRRAARGQ